MKFLMALGFASLLAACGVDGAPTRPEGKSTKPGINITGKAEVGIVGGSR